MGDLSTGLLWYFVFLFSTVLHEASHAFAALKFGDPTAYHGGQVTINPLPHIRREPFGTIVVPLFSFIMGGWMIGWASTPYDRIWARRNPHRSALMSLAGPASNLFLVVAAATLIHIGVYFDIFYAPDSINLSHITAAFEPGPWSSLASLLSIFFSLNLILCLFNLLPVPPLDGSGAAALFLDEERAASYHDFIEHPSFMFIGLFVAWKVFDVLYDPLHLFFINMLYPGVSYH